MLKHFSRENLSILREAIGKEPIGYILRNAIKKLFGRTQTGLSVLTHGVKIVALPEYTLSILDSYFEDKTSLHVKMLVEATSKPSSVKLSETDGSKAAFDLEKEDHPKHGNALFLYEGTFDVHHAEKSVKITIAFDGEERTHAFEPSAFLNNGRMDTHYLDAITKPHPRYYKEHSKAEFINSADDPSLICFYLPQFHTIPENDEWWGKGFTEWRNVSQSFPKFQGHYQPRLPGELGFYDLKNPAIMKRQVALAKQYGINGFCFHYYWFSGRKLLEHPVEHIYANPDLDISYCVNWANENWTRSWDGAEDKILLAQEYALEDIANFYKDVSKYFSDPRYIRHDDAPVLLIYRPLHIPKIAEWVKGLKKLAKDDGYKDLVIMACQSKEYIKEKQRAQLGFDFTVQFPPHHLSSYNRTLLERGYDISTMIQNAPHIVYNHSYKGQVFNYSELSASSHHYSVSPNEIESIFPMWDNCARKGNLGTPFIYSDPKKYGNWLANILQRTTKSKKPWVFINAWNEWAEGAYLEPDQHFGYGYLQRTAEVKASFSSEAKNKSLFPVNGIHRNADIAVIVHLFYLDMWDDIKTRLSNLNTSFDLYISVINENKSFEDQIKIDFPNARIYAVTNRGRDVGPFMEIMSDVRLMGYSYIAKIHSKKSPHARNGREWRDYSYDSLLGSDTIVERTIAHFTENPSVGVITGFRNVFDFEKWGLGSNQDSMEALSSLLGISEAYSELERFCERNKDKLLDDWSENLVRFNDDKDILKQPYLFPAGTMFWFKPAALDGLFSLGWNEFDFPDERQQLDGTMAHAIERMVGLLCAANGYKISYVD